MKRTVIFMLAAAAVCLFSPGAFAQAYQQNDHVEAGVYGEYYRWDQGGINLAGVGGRLSFNMTPLVQLEAEMGYDFDQVFTEQFTNGSIARTNVRRLSGLFGPKVETNRGPVRFFVTAKGGGTSFSFSGAPATFSTFASTVEDLRTSNVIAEFYPGAGAEAFFGPIGIRADVGDEIYFSNGARSNLRVTFGPTIRF
jgi:hypothetical protein